MRAGRGRANALQSPNRADADDSAATTLPHFRDHTLRQREVTAHKIEVAVEMVPGHLEKWRRRKHTRVVEQHVYAAETCNRRLHEALNGFSPANVARHIGNVLSRWVYGSSGSRQRVFAPTVENNFGSGGAETVRRVRADTGATSSDDYCFTLEAHV